MPRWARTTPPIRTQGRATMDQPRTKPRKQGRRAGPLGRCFITGRREHRMADSKRAGFRSTTGCCLVLFMFLAGACSSPLEPPCSEEGVAKCWEFIGLDNTVTVLASTEWGVFAGTLDGGVFRLDQGASWQAVGLAAAEVRAIVALPRSKHGVPELLVGVTPHINETISSAVYRSSDGGATWIGTDMGWADSTGGLMGASRLAVDSAVPGRAYWAIGSNVLHSDDGGRTWRFVAGGLDAFGGFTYGLSVGPDGTLWQCGQGAFFNAYVSRSADAGSTWETTNPTPNVDNACTALSVDPQRPTRIWIGTSTAIYTSADGGRNWSLSTSLGRPDARHAYVSAFVRLGGWLYAVGFKHQGTTVDSGLIVYARRGSGGDWVRVATPSSAAGAWAAVVGPDDRLLVGTVDGVWRFTPAS